MAVFQISTLRVKPGRLEDFLAHQDAIKEINQRYGLKSRRILRASIAGEDTGEVLIVSEFEDLIGHARWSQERSQDPEYQEWRKTTPNANPDSSSVLLSTVLMTEITR
jgi:heme-degrading monooxygenase HmoA